MVDAELAELISSKDDPEDLFELINLIGMSSFIPNYAKVLDLSLVYKALQKTTGEIFAIKIVNIVHELLH